MTGETYLEKVGLALAFVVGLAAAAFGAARRGWLRLPAGLMPAQDAPLKIVQTIGVAPGSRLMVVDFGKRRLLLAAGRTGIEVIDRGQAE